MAEIILCVAVVTLAAINLGQTFFWSRANRALIDRLMSRNYAEFVQSEKALQEVVPKKPVTVDEDSIVDEQALRELNNRMLGI
jgi:hypothetical protein